MDDDHTPVLFLSGAGLPSWIWDDVRAALPAGTGSAVSTYPRERGTTLADCARRVVDDLPWATCVLVAHSLGGVVAAELVARSPERVTGVLGVAAVVPAPGRSFLGSLPFPQGLVVGAVLRVAGTRPPEKAIRSGLTAGLPPATADRVVAEFAPESARLYRDRVGPRTLPAHRGYVHTSADRELTAGVQAASARRLDAGWSRTLATGHLPMLQDPAALADAVGSFLAARPDAAA